MIDTSQAWAQFDYMQRVVIASTPNLILASITFALFLFLGRSIRKVIHHFVGKNKKHLNLTLVLERIAYGITILVGVFVSLSIIIPSFKAADLIQLLGIGSVAFGFAFKDILQNFLSGILILLTDPFHIGDTIVVKEFEGVVEDIQTRATFIKTADGQKIVIPNTDLFINAVTVQTAYDFIRKDVNVRVNYSTNLKQAISAITDKLKTLSVVAKDPAPAAYVTELGDSNVNLRVYWWFNQREVGSFKAVDIVMNAITDALEESKISIAHPVQHIVLDNSSSESAVKTTTGRV